MSTDFRDPTLAAKNVCDLALSSLPAHPGSIITGLHQQAEKAMPLTLTRGPRSLVEPILVRALDLTSAMTIVQMKGVPYLKCWRVDTAEAIGGASVMTILAMPDDKELAMALLLWRGDDGLLYAAINPIVAKAALSPPSPSNKSGCLGALLLAVATAILAGLGILRGNPS
jgi:hypothetical protein